MKKGYWRRFYSSLFFVSAVLFILSSSTLHSGGGNKMDDDHDTTSSKSGSSSNVSTAVSNTLWAEGSYSNANGGEKSHAAGDNRYKTPSFTKTHNMGGRIEASFNVDAKSGASQYTIPLKTPNGHKNMHPKLTLTYTSGGANTHYGVGWDLVGLPSVTRCGTNKKYEGDQTNGELYNCQKSEQRTRRKSSCTRRSWGVCKSYRYWTETYTHTYTAKKGCTRNQTVP